MTQSRLPKRHNNFQITGFFPYPWVQHFSATSCSCPYILCFLEQEQKLLKVAALRTHYCLCRSSMPPRTPLAVGGPCFQNHQCHPQHHMPASCFLAKATYSQERDGTDLKCCGKAEMAMAEEGAHCHPCHLLLFNCPHSFHPALINGCLNILRRVRNPVSVD